MNYETIDVGFKKLHRIFHIADLHIRNVKRHEEYRQVFKNFLEEIDQPERASKKSIIYIAGDIAHAKTEMSPELIQMISNFLSECSSRYPTVLIPGNHDCNQNNANRLDALSPIIDNMNNPNIHYLKDSGVYRLADINLVHYGIFEDPKDWPTPPDDGRYNIGLFHGPVDASETDTGFVLYDTDTTPETFEGCPLVLCGDIHKRQIIPESDNPLIAYAGSLVQQNHGEALDGHGFMQWNFTDGKLEDADFQDIVNDYGYYTLEINNGVIPNVDDMPKNPRLRIQVQNTTSADLKLALVEFRKKHNIKSYTINRLDVFSRDGKTDNTLTFGDVTNVEYQLELLKDYLDRKFSLDMDTVSEIAKINADLNSRLSEEEIIRNVVWKPISLKFDNMFSYGLGNSLEFTDLAGLYGLFAPNRSGKSSVLDVMLFCLFDKSSKTFKADHIKNRKSDGFECEFKFQIADTEYVIERVATQGAKSLRVPVSFYKLEDGVRIPLNGADRNGTNANIRNHIGTYDDFIATTISLQGNNSTFIKKKQSQRKDLLSQFMGIGIYDRLNKLASTDTKERAAQVKLLKKVDHDEILTELDEELDGVQSEFDTTKVEVKAIEKDVIKLRDKISTKEASMVKVDVHGNDLEKLEDTLATFEYEISKLEIDLEGLNSKLSEHTKQFKRKSKKLDKVDVDEITFRHDRNEELSTKVRTIKGKAVELKTAIISKKARLSSVKDEYDYDEDCGFCVFNAKGHIKLVSQLEEEISNDKSNMKSLIESARIINKEMSELNVDNTIYVEYTNAIRLVREVSKLELAKSESENRVARLSGEIQNRQNRLLPIAENIQRFKDNKDQIDKNTKIELELSLLNKELSALSETYDSKYRVHTSAIGNLRALETRIESTLEQIEQLRELENEYAVYEYYLTATKRDGIPSELIAKTLPAIENEVNNILGQTQEFTISLEVDGKDIVGKINEDGSSWLVELSSGMEQFIIDLCMRVATMNVCSLPRSNFLVVDEGFGNLDSENLTSMFTMFEYLRSQFEFVIVISHLDVMRDVVDKLIEIKKEDGFSYINYP